MAGGDFRGKLTISSSMTYNTIILGAGAAGLMCAIEAGRRWRSVVVLERNDEAGRKILISGGGRCNFTNVHAGPEHFFSQNPHFCRSALAAYLPPESPPTTTFGPAALLQRFPLPSQRERAG